MSSHKEDVSFIKPYSRPHNIYNPLHFYLTTKLSDNPGHKHIKNEKEDYLIVPTEEQSPRQALFPAKKTHQHFRVDSSYIELANGQTKKGQPFFHHTTWYDDTIVVHVYFNTLGNVLYVQAKQDDKELPLTSEQKTLAIQNAVPNCAIMLNYIHQYTQLYATAVPLFQELQRGEYKSPKDGLKKLKKIQAAREIMRLYGTSPVAEQTPFESNLQAKLTAASRAEPEDPKAEAPTPTPPTKAKTAPDYSELRDLLDQHKRLKLHKPKDMLKAYQLAQQISFHEVNDKQLRKEMVEVLKTSDATRAWITCMANGTPSDIDTLIAYTKDDLVNYFYVFKTLFGITSTIKIPTFSQVFVNNCDHLFNLPMENYLFFLNVLNVALPNGFHYLASLFNVNELTGFKMLLRQGLRGVCATFFLPNHCISLLRLVAYNDEFLNAVLAQSDILIDPPAEPFQIFASEKTSSSFNSVPTISEFVAIKKLIEQPSDLCARLFLTDFKPIPQRLLDESDLHSLALALAILIGSKKVTSCWLFSTSDAGIVLDYASEPGRLFMIEQEGNLYYGWLGAADTTFFGAEKGRIYDPTLRHTLSQSQEEFLFHHVNILLDETGSNITFFAFTSYRDILANLQKLLGAFEKRLQATSALQRKALFQRLHEEASQVPDLEIKADYFLACLLLLCMENPLELEASQLFLQTLIEVTILLKTSGKPNWEGADRDLKLFKASASHLAGDPSRVMAPRRSLGLYAVHEQSSGMSGSEPESNPAP